MMRIFLMSSLLGITIDYKEEGKAMIGLFASLAAALLLLVGSASAHEESVFVHYHYYYDSHGFLVLVPVVHEWDHPHAVSGTMFVHTPHIHHAPEVHGIHRVHGVHGFRHHGGIRYHHGGH